MYASLQDALSRLVRGVPSPQSLVGRALCWTDGWGLWTRRQLLAAPLEGGAWVLNASYINRAPRGYYNLHSQLRHFLQLHGALVYVRSPGTARTVAEWVGGTGEGWALARSVQPCFRPAGATAYHGSRRIAQRRASDALPAWLSAPAAPASTTHPTPRLAFELEVEFAGSCPTLDASEAAWTLGPVVRDGSIRNGWEFKTRTPQLLAAWRASALPARLAQLRALDAIESHERAGLHVHVDRASFSPAGMVRLFTVVNHPDEVLRGLSRRGHDTSYCAFRPHITDWAGRTAVEKYSAVYLHHTYPTAELRLFRSTVHPERLFAALEAAEALWAYCEGTSLEASGAAWAEWVATHPNYALLAAELRRQGALAPAPVLGAVNPLRVVPVRRVVAPTPPTPPAPTPAAQQPVILGAAPNGTIYHWNAAQAEVQFRRSDGPWRRSTHWPLPADPAAFSETQQFFAEQLRSRGLWEAPAAAPAAAAAPHGADLPTTEQPLGHYGGTSYRWSGQRVEFQNGHGGWEVSSSSVRCVASRTDGSRTVVAVPPGRGQDAWVYNRLLALGQSQGVESTPEYTDLGINPHNGFSYRWNHQHGVLEYNDEVAGWVTSRARGGDTVAWFTQRCAELGLPYGARPVLV